MRSKEYPLCGKRVYRTRLSCGLSLLVIPQPGFSRKFAALAVRCGSTDTAWKLDGVQAEAPAGTAHFLEHTLFEMPWGSAMDRLSAMGVSANAFTGPFETVYHISCTDGFSNALSCLLEFVTEPWFPAQIVLREQGIIAQEIGMLADRPEYAVHYGLLESLFSSHPVRYSAAGTKESIREITPEILETYYRAFYRMRNMTLCVAGDVDPDKIAALAEGKLSPAGDDLPESTAGTRDPLEPREPRVLRTMPVANPLFRLGARITPLQGENLLQQELTAMLALSVLLGEGSDLYARAYEENLIGRKFGWNVSAEGGVPYWTAGGESRDPAAYCAKLGKQAEDLGAWGVDADLLRRRKKALYGGLLRMTDHPEELCIRHCRGVFRDYEPLAAFEILDRIGPDEIQKWIGENAQAKRLAISVVKNSRESR